VLGCSFGHRLLILASTPLFIHRVGPQHLGRTGFDQLNRDIPLVFDSGTIGEQAAGDLAPGRFLFDLDGSGFQNIRRLGSVGDHISGDTLLGKGCGEVGFKPLLRFDVDGGTRQLGQARNWAQQRGEYDYNGLRIACS